MNTSSLSIVVGELLGVPKVTVRGDLNGWHDQAILGVLAAFRDEGASSLVLDIAAINLINAEGATGLVNVLRALGSKMCVHVVASDAPAKILGKAGLGVCVRLYSSTDEIAKHVSNESIELTSRWIESGGTDNEMPLAA